MKEEILQTVRIGYSPTRSEIKITITIHKDDVSDPVLAKAAFVKCCVENAKRDAEEDWPHVWDQLHKEVITEKGETSTKNG